MDGGRTVASATPDGAEVLDAAIVGFIASHNLSHFKGARRETGSKIEPKEGPQGTKESLKGPKGTLI